MDHNGYTEEKALVLIGKEIIVVSLGVVSSGQILEVRLVGQCCLNWCVRQEETRVLGICLE